MIYPRVYFQMKKMIKICKKLYNTAHDKAYVDNLILELESQCKQLEAEAREDCEALAYLDELTRISK